MRTRGALIFAGALALGCSADPEKRPQAVLFVHTTAPIVGELGDRPELSSDLAVNKLRVDVIDEGSPYELREFLADDPAAWPLSFGLVADTDRTVRLRLRAYHAARSSPEVTPFGTRDKPWPETAIDRVVDLRLRASGGVEPLSVVLDAECVGLPPSFFGAGSTCVAEDRREGAPDQGISTGNVETPAKAAIAMERPCRGEPVTEAVCVPGGYSVLGDPYYTESLDLTSDLGSAPIRPVLVSPFWMDRTEFTVGRFRNLVASGAYQGLLPSSSADECSFLGVDDPTNDELALTCVTVEEAEEICASVGGALPSEARWEHAARGRGQARSFPWGEEEPNCCRASLWRSTPLNAGGCTGTGPERVVSHRDCPDGGDVSRDGVFDLGGGVSEFTADAARPYEHECWAGDGALVDPICEDDTAPDRVQRGGNWSTGLGTALGALRYYGTKGDVVGFRCVYEDSP